MSDWNAALEGLVNRQVKKLVDQKRAEMVADWDAPADYDDPLGGMSAVELDNIQQLMETYAIKARRKVESQVWQQWLAHVAGVIKFE